MSTATISAEPIITPEDAMRFRRRRQVRSWVARMVLAVLILVSLILGPPVFKHLRSTLYLMASGASVDWVINEDNWKQGGFTSVSFSVNSRTDGRFTNLDMARMTGLHRLESLDLANAFDISELGLRDLKLLPDLQVLDLTRVDGPVGGVTAPPPLLSDKALKHVKPLTKLRELILVGNPITDDGLAHLEGMTSLELLNLERTRVTDAGLRHLKGLTNLKTLDVSETRVTLTGATELRAALPNVDISRTKENTGE